MKSKDAGLTITNNDGLVRLRIFDGVIPPDDYHREMAELERGQHKAARDEFLEIRSLMEKRIAELEAELVCARADAALWRGRYEGARAAVAPKASDTPPALPDARQPPTPGHEEQISPASTS